MEKHRKRELLWLLLAVSLAGAGWLLMAAMFTPLTARAASRAALIGFSASSTRGITLYWKVDGVIYEIKEDAMSKFAKEKGVRIEP